MHPERVNRQYDLVIDNLNNIPRGSKVLEIGSGMNYMKKFFGMYVTYDTMDIGEEEEYTYDYNLDKLPIPIKSKTYDVIICMMTLEHIMYPERVIKEMLRMAKKDALFFICLPNDYNFMQRIYYLLGKKSIDDEPFQVVEKHLHIHKPRIKDINKLFSDNFNILEKRYFWQSKSSMTSLFAYCCDYCINILASIWPSMFARGMVIMGEKK